MPATAKLLEDSLLVIWNDRDADRRSESMKKVYATDIHFYETDNGEPVIGHQAINELIATLQADWPQEFQFQLSKPLQVNHATQVITWRLGPQGSAPVATGMDVAFIENGLIQSLYLFLDVADK